MKRVGTGPHEPAGVRQAKKYSVRGQRIESGPKVRATAVQVIVVEPEQGAGRKALRILNRDEVPLLSCADLVERLIAYIALYVQQYIR